MLTKERRYEIQNEFAKTIQGGCFEDMWRIIDGWIENYDDNEPYFKMSQQEFHDNEAEICEIYDAGWFQCRDCGWNVPGDMRSYQDEECCMDCVPNEE